MSYTIKHLSHPKHPLILKEVSVIGVDATCYACGKSVVASPTYTCTHPYTTCQNFYLHKTCAHLTFLVEYHEHPLRVIEEDSIGTYALCCVCDKTLFGSPTYTCIRDDKYKCRSFYVHKSCAELPPFINHHKHDLHPLTLLPRRLCICNVCRRIVSSAYACADCEFDVCVICAFEQRVLHHQGHKKHPLTLMKNEVRSHCDACEEKLKDSTYVCTICELWIHKSCALSPYTIINPSYHHHHLDLVYSLPEMHRSFERSCGICQKVVHRSCWMYYCDKCTYFVHIKCASSKVSMTINEVKSDAADNEREFAQIPLPSEESIFDLINAQFGRLQLVSECESTEGMNSTPHIIEKHWSHIKHPLQLQFVTGENDKNDNDDDRRVLICDGCIQPLTVSHPSYYACTPCRFFLHSFCATKLPKELPAGFMSIKSKAFTRA